MISSISLLMGEKKKAFTACEDMPGPGHSLHLQPKTGMTSGLLFTCQLPVAAGWLLGYSEEEES